MFLLLAPSETIYHRTVQTHHPQQHQLGIFQDPRGAGLQIRHVRVTRLADAGSAAQEHSALEKRADHRRLREIAIQLQPGHRSRREGGATAMGKLPVRIRHLLPQVIHPRSHIRADPEGLQ